MCRRRDVRAQALRRRAPTSVIEDAEATKARHSGCITPRVRCE